MRTFRNWIDGAYQDPVEGQWLDTTDPYRGEAWARVPRGASADAESAVAAAKRAMTVGPWSTMSATDRGRVMRRIGDLVAVHAERLAAIEVRDNGKLLAEINGQLKGKAEYWYYYAGLADKIEGRTMPLAQPGMLAFTTPEPVGVVLALTAWNSPLLFLAMKVAPALAAGCAVVVKPSEFASASSLEFAEITKEAGLPDGVLNVVAGLGQEIGAALVEHPDVAKITFTGSDVTGIRIAQAAAKTIKHVSLELGGKSPNIVFEDADLDNAAMGAVTGVFGASGQMCIAGSRLLVQNSIKEAFTAKVLELARRVRMGDPMAPDTNVGPIATPPQFEKVLRYIDVARSEGARCVLGGAKASGPGLVGGQFVEPTVFTDVTNGMRIAREEVFGPILSIIGFDTEEEAVAIGNDTPYGLVAGVWTRDIGRAVRLSKALKAGTIWVNTYRFYSHMVPFGGMKLSGLGRENGIETVNEFLETKAVFLSDADLTIPSAFVLR